MPASPESVLLFNALPTPHLLLSPEFVIEAVSDSYLHATLTRREHLVGQYMFDAFPDNPQTPGANGMRNVRASLRQVLATRQPQQIAQQHYDVPDPERPGQFVERYWQALNAPVLDAQGNVTQIIHAAVNITAEVQAQDQLRKSQVTEQVALGDAEVQRQRFYDLLMQLPAAVVTYRGSTHVYDLVNPPYQQLFRHRRLQGLPIREALPELVGQDIIEKLDHVYASGEAYYAWEQETWVDVTDTGRPEQRYYNVLFQPLRDAHGRVDGLLSFAYDVTEQVQSRQQLQQLNQELEIHVQQRIEDLAVSNEELQATNEELQQSNRQLTRTNVDLDTFVYTASHDLKAPITNIESIVLALRDTLPPAVQRDGLVSHLLDLLNQTVTRFQATITQLTDISRLQLTHVGPAEPVVLATVVQDVHLDLMPTIVAAGAQLNVEVPAELVVSFSPANLRSIVYNLLSNAVKYRAFDRPSQVWVQAAHTGAAVVLTVRDNGLGMSEVQQRQLFGLFQRLHTHVEGTGVGLYLTKRLIENAGGTIAVQSQSQVGTTFTVTFPA
jgi:signal transduction histidine kinase